MEEFNKYFQHLFMGHTTKKGLENIPASLSPLIFVGLFTYSN